MVQMTPDFTVADAARLTNQSPETVRRWAKAGEVFQVVPDSRRPLLITAESVLAERRRILDELGAVEPGQAPISSGDGATSSEVFELKVRLRALIAAHQAMLDTFRQGLGEADSSA